MTSQILREVRNYEETFEKGIKEQERPAFHLSPRVGWMNDPNGFSFYDGKYHLFYQYYPYNSHWGLMHWGHAVSSDLLHWEYLPAALAPDEAYDKDGCFSGSAVTLPDGKQLLMYTGVAKETQEDGSVCEVQRQCIAVGDGINYEKYAGNPVLTEADLPEGSSRFDFRDPKVWQGSDGSYYAVVEAGLPMAAVRYYCSKVLMDLIGNSIRCCVPISGATEKCGNVLIFLNWTESRFCW